MRHIYLLLLVVLPVALWAQTESTGTFHANIDFTIYGNAGNLALQKGEQARYNLTNGIVLIEKDSLSVIKPEKYFNKLVKRGDISILTEDVSVATESVAAPAGEKDVPTQSDSDLKTQRKLDIIIGHLIVGDIAIVAALIWASVR